MDIKTRDDNIYPLAISKHSIDCLFNIYVQIMLRCCGILPVADPTIGFMFLCSCQIVFCFIMQFLMMNHPPLRARWHYASSMTWLRMRPSQTCKQCLTEAIWQFCLLWVMYSPFKTSANIAYTSGSSASLWILNKSGHSSLHGNLQTANCPPPSSWGLHLCYGQISWQQ